MNKSAVSAVVLTISSTLFSGMAQADFTSSMATAVKEGKLSLNLRYRFEGVSQDGVAKDAKASTLKTRATWVSGKMGDFSVGWEVDNVTVIGDDDYNNTLNGKTQYPVVADPRGTDVNQIYLKYSKSHFSWTLGRQRIVHNDQRFVGGVAWRQNEQTYDGLTFTYNNPETFSGSFSYLHNINRIFGPSGAGADRHGEFYLADGAFSPVKGHKIALFGYSLDYDTVAGASSNTIGARYTGKFNNFKLMLSAASQSDNGDNPNDFDAGYWAIEGSGKVGGVTLGVGYEELGSDNGVGFSTTLATLHKFQGFADQFLGTPGSGIEDLYIKIGTKVGDVNLKAIWHDFSASEGGGDYGTELDLIASYKINKHFSLLGKYATYDSDGYKVDVDKFWLMVNAKF
jgi:hypothetical protein